MPLDRLPGEILKDFRSAIPKDEAAPPFRALR
jgi:hypothetical protein